MNTATTAPASTADRVAKIVAEHLGVQESDSRPEKKLVGDLGADSLDTVEIVMAVEHEFGLEIPDEEAEKFATVGDITAYVEKYAA